MYVCGGGREGGSTLPTQLQDPLSGPLQASPFLLGLLLGSRQPAQHQARGPGAWTGCILERKGEESRDCLNPLLLQHRPQAAQPWSSLLQPAEDGRTVPAKLLAKAAMPGTWELLLGSAESKPHLYLELFHP